MFTIEQISTDTCTLKHLIDEKFGDNSVYQELLNFYGFFETLKANFEYKEKMEEAQAGLVHDLADGDNDDGDDDDDGPIKLVR